MLIVMTFFVALLCGAVGGLLYHMQQPAKEREFNAPQDIAFPHARKGNEKPDESSRFHLGVYGDCLYGAVGGILLLALLNRLIGNFVGPIFNPAAVAANGPETIFIAWLYLIATSMVGGYLGLRLLRLATGSSFVHWKRQLDLCKQNIEILEEELRESRSGVLLADGVEKLRRGYYREALSDVQSASVLTPGRARVLGLLGLCKSFLAEEKNRVAGQEHVTFEQALQDLNEAIRLAEEHLDHKVDGSVTGPLYYNRACVQYLKWRSQGRSPSKLTDDEVDKLKADIQRALRQDPGHLIWRALQVDCGTGKQDGAQADDPNLTRDFRDLHDNSPAFKSFILELKEERSPTFGIAQLHKNAVAFNMDELPI